MCSCSRPTFTTALWWPTIPGTITHAMEHNGAQMVSISGSLQSLSWIKILSSFLISQHLIPDHEEFLRMAKTYASNHDNMASARHCGDNFNNGVTNGAQWYPITGGMQDFNYLYGGAMEITVEVSCCKFPDKAKLFDEWFYNDLAFLGYLEQAQTGIKGGNLAGHLRLFGNSELLSG